MDEYKKNVLNVKDFLKAFKEYRIDLDEAGLRAIISTFGSEKDGTIHYGQFLREVRGPLNSSRKKIVAAAFQRLDRKGAGIVEINELKAAYNAHAHPDVRFGKISEDEALGEFLETFEMYVDILFGGKEQKIGQGEFEDYYAYVGSAVEDDKQFEQMIVGVWKLYEEEAKRMLTKDLPGMMPGLGIKSKNLTVTQAAPFGTTDAKMDYSTALRPAKQVAKAPQAQAVPAGYPSWPTYEKPRTAHEETKYSVQETSEEKLFQNFKQTIMGRGVRGIFGLQRAFKITDVHGTGRISLPAFKKVVKEYRVKMLEQDVEKIFRVFDQANSGEISYSDFLGTLNVTKLLQKNKIGRDESVPEEFSD